MRLSAVMVHSSHHYQTQIQPQITVREVARYLSQYESHIEARTLEVLRPVQPHQRLQELDMRGGDRLIIFSQPTKNADLPLPLRAGDKIVKFRAGDFEAQSRGKRALLVGKPDEDLIPDIDLRYFVPLRALDWIAPSCLRLNFDEYSRTWYIVRVGETRVKVDELELGSDRVALNREQGLRFYAPNGEMIGQVRVLVETVQSREDALQLPPGNETVMIGVGLEKDSQTLRASDNIRMGQVATSLALHNRAPFVADLRLYVARLAAPNRTVGEMRLGQGEFLYTALNLRYARNVLLLRDVHQPDQVYIVVAGREDEEKFVGCRAQRDSQNPSLDVDLYESLMTQDMRLFQEASPYLGRILYRAAEQTWWIRPEERAPLPLFVNNSRMVSGAAVQLTAGDVLSFGTSVTHYYARLAVEVSARST